MGVDRCTPLSFKSCCWPQLIIITEWCKISCDTRTADVSRSINDNDVRRHRFAQHPQASATPRTKTKLLSVLEPDRMADTFAVTSLAQQLFRLVFFTSSVSGVSATAQQSCVRAIVCVHENVTSISGCVRACASFFSPPVEMGAKLFYFRSPKGITCASVGFSPYLFPSCWKSTLKLFVRRVCSCT